MTPKQAVAAILERELCLAEGDEDELIAELELLGFEIVPKQESLDDIERASSRAWHENEIK